MLVEIALEYLFERGALYSMIYYCKLAELLGVLELHYLITEG